MFVTVFLGIMDVGTGAVVFCNGGHNPPYLIHRDGTTEPLPKIGGMALGVMEGIPFGKGSVTLEHGDTLVMYTDGVTEAVNVHDNLFTEQLLVDILRDNEKLTPREVGQHILDRVAEFSSGAEQADDITVLALKYR